MWLVLVVCAAPVIASYLTFYVVRPEGRTNYGSLIEPPRPLPMLALTTLDGRPAPAAGLHGQWLLLAVGEASCDPSCERRLFLQRQLREMLGRDRDRVDKVWLVTGAGVPAAALQAAANPSAAPLTMLRADRAAIARWLEPAAGHALEDHLYIVDPRGEWIMRMPADPDPTRVKRDLERLLRASAGWDRPGR